MSCTLCSSCGNIVFDRSTGKVSACSVDDLDPDFGSLPVRVDVFEWKMFYCEALLDDTEHDVLDFGFWCEDGTYVPPSYEWREDARENRREDAKLLAEQWPLTDAEQASKAEALQVVAAHTEGRLMRWAGSAT
jgi:hypothetical protein